MALVFKGQSECLICGKVIEPSDDMAAFPAFLGKTHPLHQYSDAAMHQRCFDSSPDKEEVERLYSKFRTIWASRPKHLKAKEEIEAWGRAALAEFQ